MNDGRLAEMPTEGAPHTRLKMRIARSLIAQAGDGVQVIIGSPLHLSPVDAPRPDLYLYDAGLPLEAVNGANLGLVIEIAEASLAQDLSIKAELYAEHGVRDYWVVDVGAGAIIVHRNLAGGLYRDVVTYSARETIQPLAFPALSLCLADLPPIR